MEIMQTQRASKARYYKAMEELLAKFPIMPSKHLYARKLRAAARLKKRRGIVLDMPKKQNR